MFAALVLAGSLGLANMVNVPAGEYRPLYLTKDSSLVSVDEFEIDRLPITNSEYLEFVSNNPEWNKGNIPSVFADSRYLQHWEENKSNSTWRPENVILKNAVINVSWFAAQAFCNTQGKHLPTVAQWEYVASASESNADGHNEPDYQQRILRWYAQHHDAEDLKVGVSAANYWGIHDLHGLVWEWTEDFNSALVSGESRADSSINEKLYCAAGSVGSADPSDYAAFMRHGFRSSLQANYSLPNLGFRCSSERSLQNEIN